MDKNCPPASTTISSASSRTAQTTRIAIGSQRSRHSPANTHPLILDKLYMSFFFCNKMQRIGDVIDEVPGRLGVRVGVDDAYFRPSLWRLYESQCPGYRFLQGMIVNSRLLFRSSWIFTI